MVLDKLKSLFAPRSAAPQADEGSAMRLAVAALLVEAGRVDQEFSLDERVLVERLLDEEFAIGGDAVRDLIREAEAALGNSANLHRHTKIAKALAPEDRARLIENMWKVVLSDETRDPYEDALIRKVCGLLYVDDTESAAARRRAAAALGLRAGL